MTNCSLKYRRRQDEKRKSNKTETDWMVMNNVPERRLEGENRCVLRGLTSTVTATDGWQQVGQPLCCTSDLSTWEQTDRPSAWGLDLLLLRTCVRYITYRNQGVFHLCQISLTGLVMLGVGWTRGSEVQLSEDSAKDQGWDENKRYSWHRGQHHDVCLIPTGSAASGD